MIFQEFAQAKDLLNENEDVILVLNTFRSENSVHCRIGDVKIDGMANGGSNGLLHVTDKDGDQVFFSVQSLVCIIKKKVK